MTEQRKPLQMTKRECIVLGHLLGAEQSLIEVDFESTRKHIENALLALRKPEQAPK